MTSDTIAWLTQEMHDLLDAGSVGLYEFLWALNKPGDAVPVEQRKQIARRALEHLVGEPGVELAWLRWPDWDILNKVNVNELPEDPWAEPDDSGMYLALVRTD